MMQTRLLHTSTFQFAAFYMALFAVSVVLLLGLIYWTTVGFISSQTDDTIEIEVTGLAEQYRQRGLNGLAKVISDRVRADPDSSTIYLFANRDHTPLAGNLPEWPLLEPANDGWVNFSRVDASGREIPARARLFVLRGGLHLLVGRDIRELKQTEELIRRGLGWGLSLSVGLGILGGLLMSRRVNHRIDLINQTSREIMDGDLSRRIPGRGTGDEFDQLGSNLNAMLDQIEELMQGVRHVADNIAHDLRTPLTRLRNHLEVLRAEPAETGNSEEIEGCIAEADQLLQTFAALLRIARIESGGHKARRDDVALDHLVQDACDMYQALAEQRGVTLKTITVPATVRGDRDLLFQALINLTDNAIKYTPPGGEIDLAVVRADGQVCLEVRDTGPGIPDRHKDRVTRRFYRLDESRGAMGNGLGLSLVKAVADRHLATLTLADHHPGLIVRMCFPGTDRPDSAA